MHAHEAKQKALAAEQRAKGLRRELRRLSREVMTQRTPGDTLMMVERMRECDRNANEATEEAKAWHWVSRLIVSGKL